jgi:trigger factor
MNPATSKQHFIPITQRNKIQESTVEVKIEDISSVQKRLNITVASDKVKNTFTKHVNNLRKKSKIHGFRPGKAPLRIVTKIYHNEIISEVSNQLIRENIQEAIQTNKLQPIAPPSIDAINVPVETQPYNFTAIIDIMPEIKLTDKKYQHLEISCAKIEFKEQEIEKNLEILAKQKSKLLPIIDKKIQAAYGLSVIISHRAEFLDGSNIEKLSVSKFQTILGDKQILDDLEKSFLGMTADEQKIVTIKIKDNYEDPDFRNKEIRFYLELHELSKVELPKLNDTFAKVFNFKTIDELRSAIAKNIKQNIENSNKQTKENATLHKLRETYTFEVPPAIINQTIDDMIKKHNQGQDINKLLKDNKIRKILLPEAKNVSKNTLLLGEIIKTEKLSVDDDEIKSNIKQNLPIDKQSPKDIASTLKQIDLERFREQLLFNKAMNKLVDYTQFAYYSPEPVKNPA